MDEITSQLETQYEFTFEYGLETVSDQYPQVPETEFSLPIHNQSFTAVLSLADLALVLVEISYSSGSPGLRSSAASGVSALP